MFSPVQGNFEPAPHVLRGKHQVDHGSEPPRPLGLFLAVAPFLGLTKVVVRPETPSPVRADARSMRSSASLSRLAGLKRTRWSEERRHASTSTREIKSSHRLRIALPDRHTSSAG